ncbi:hypothetical protein Taro_012552, partial [Colocasia esculenta]|nr:hypothetical protein [Colocasia esculenta]
FVIVSLAGCGLIFYGDSERVITVEQKKCRTFLNQTASTITMRLGSPFDS